jgi:hypothetical protein
MALSDLLQVVATLQLDQLVCDIANSIIFYLFEVKTIENYAVQKKLGICEIHNQPPLLIYETSIYFSSHTLLTNSSLGLKFLI